MSIERDLSNQSVSAVKWNSLGTGVRYSLQLGAQVLLARLLGPDYIGLFAMGMVILSFSNFIADAGFGWSLMQAKDIRDEDIRFAFTCQVIAGAVVTLAIYLLAPAAAAYFQDARLEGVVRWLSWAALLGALSSPASNLLRRKLDFRTINIVQLVSFAVGYLIVGIPLAIHGAGVWALVAACLAQAACALLLFFLRQPHSVKPLLWYDGAKTLGGTGGIVFLTNICNWFLNNMDRIILGRFAGAQVVGLYVVGYNLAQTPHNVLLSALQPAFLVAGARLQTDAARLRRAYLAVIATVWIGIAPMFVLFAVIAPDLVALLYGSAWRTAGEALTILALAMPAYLTWGMSTPILWNTGRKHYEIILQLPLMAVAVVAFYNVVGLGVVMFALVAAGLLLSRAMIITVAACRRLDVAPRDLAPSALRALAMILLSAIGTAAGAALARIGGDAHLGPVCGGVFVGCAVLIITSLLYPRLLGRAVIEMLQRFSPPVFAGVLRYMLSKSN